MYFHHVMEDCYFVSNLFAVLKQYSSVDILIMALKSIHLIMSFCDTQFSHLDAKSNFQSREICFILSLCPVPSYNFLDLSMVLQGLRLFLNKVWQLDSSISSDVKFTHLNLKCYQQDCEHFCFHHGIVVVVLCVLVSK